MKSLIITSIVALGVAAPALAQSQLEQAVGAQAGEYTLNELVLLKTAQDTDNGERNVFLGNSKIQFSASDIHNTKAADIFATIDAEQTSNN